MSTPDTQHMIRVVAMEFLGWKPGQNCTWCSNHDEYRKDGFDGEYYHYDHEIPPPNLLESANAWALENALWAQRIYAMPSFNGDELDLCRIGVPEDIRVSYAEIFKGNRTLALLTAAYQLTEEGRK